ncbi:MAG: type II toxin-antitoxin system RelE/ParE family toxin [Oscillospiraceae bacterium]|nr:type II toxin-antitoxin system RelE/ParE family toxin [Oscillospiraceae bacterium]
MGKTFTLHYLPLFERDIASARDYIAQNLQNPAAALRLVADTEKAILKRLENPLAFEPYRSNRDRVHPYYRINIRNYTVFYVVIGNVMEVRRFVYSKRDLPHIL